MAREKKASVSVEDTVITFDFEQAGEQLSIDVAALNDETKTRGLLHGIRQKIQDSYAGVDGDKAHVAAGAVIDAIMSGSWTQRTEGSGGGAARTSMLAEALARATGQDLDACIAKLSTMEDEQKKAVRAHPAVKKAMSEIKLERAQAELDKAGTEGEDVSLTDLVA